MRKFAIGRRWRVEGPTRRFPFEFVIIGKVADKAVTCRIEADDHDHRIYCACGHGAVDIFTHKHLKKYAVLLEPDAPTQVAMKTPIHPVAA